MALTGRYLAAMATSAISIGVSAFLPSGIRVIVWAVFVGAWSLGAMLIERTPVEGEAGDDRAPQSSAWLLTASIAIVLGALVFTMRTLRDSERLRSIYRPLSVAMVIAAAASLLVGWLRPVPWLLVLLVVAILSAVWWLAVDRWLRLEDPTSIAPG